MTLMKTVRYDEDADEESIDEIARYELRREGLGIEFLTAVRVRQFGRRLTPPPRRGSFTRASRP